MAIDNFKTENRTFDNLLNNNGIVYKIPVFQRDYSWTLNQWDDLWSDIIDTINESGDDYSKHYMGYLLLKKDKEAGLKCLDMIIGNKEDLDETFYQRCQKMPSGIQGVVYQKLLLADPNIQIYIDFILNI